MKRITPVLKVVNIYNVYKTNIFSIFIARHKKYWIPEWYKGKPGSPKTLFSWQYFINHSYSLSTGKPL